MLGAAPATVLEHAAATSPLAQVHSSAPPFLLVHGHEDSLVACSHSESPPTHCRKPGLRSNCGRCRATTECRILRVWGNGGGAVGMIRTTQRACRDCAVLMAQQGRCPRSRCPGLL
ncbi:hypothetical protein [Streptomyces sp. NBC_00212]|uniref:hypothetical protein n=1 Tax=Streptomyces sp. NBC_00212 TaxID=2975684 RepID=UPI003868DC14